MSIVDFITARLNDDQRIALATIDINSRVDMRLGAPATPWTYNDGQVWSIDTDRSREVVRVGQTWDREGAHIARHDPARVLREVQAKRAILAEHGDNEGQCARCLDDDGVWVEDGRTVAYTQPWPCRTIRALANVYVDHPDFVAEWKL